MIIDIYIYWHNLCMILSRISIKGGDRFLMAFYGFTIFADQKGRPEYEQG
jgi:hypothetical protein